MRHLGSLALAALLVAGAAGTAAAQGKTQADSLARRAKISEASARKRALARVPGGTVQSEKLEREHGKLTYSYDIKTAGRAGVEEVNVDAMTGKVRKVAHESAAAERKERRMDRRHPPAHRTSRKRLGRPAGS